MSALCSEIKKVLKSGLCSNNKSTAISIVSFKGMLVNKIQTS